MSTFLNEYRETDEWKSLKESAGLYFKFAFPYKGQLEVIADIVYSFKVLGKKHVILDAPTGSGKSVIAMTVHEMLMDSGVIHRTRFITATKQLQHQYNNEFGLDVLMGKTNYSCPYEVGPYLGTTACLHNIKMKNCTGMRCPYVKARYIWQFISSCSVTNTAFMLKACPLVYQGRNYDAVADFMVIDECHKLEQLILESSELTFSTDQLYNLVGIYERLNILPLLDEINNIIKIASIHKNGEPFEIGDDIIDHSKKLLVYLEDMRDFLLSVMGKLNPNIKSDMELGEILGIAVNEVDSMINSTKLVIQVGPRGQVYISDGSRSNKVSLNFVFAKLISDYCLFRKADKFLHMSGTICGYEYHLEKLGLNIDDCMYISYDNNIPIENRTIHVIPRYRVRNNYINPEMSKMIGMMDQIIDNYDGFNGIIYCPSFQMSSTVRDYSRHKDIIKVALSAGEAKDTLIMTNRTNNRAIICSPSLVEGIDLKGDLSRFQIITRLPWLVLGDPLVKAKLEYDESYYYRTTCMKLVQICGRSVRGQNDWAHTYILDSAMPKLIDMNKKYFPKWFLDSIRIYG